VLPGETDRLLQTLTLTAVSVTALALAVAAFRLPVEPPVTRAAPPRDRVAT
jgi:hypothetical protein